MVPQVDPRCVSSSSRSTHPTNTVFFHGNAGRPSRWKQTGPVSTTSHSPPVGRPNAPQSLSAHLQCRVSINDTWFCQADSTVYMIQKYEKWFMKILTWLNGYMIRWTMIGWLIKRFDDFDDRWLNDALVMITNLTCTYAYVTGLLNDWVSSVNGDISGFLLDDRHW